MDLLEDGGQNQIGSVQMENSEPNYHNKLRSIQMDKLDEQYALIEKQMATIRHGVGDTIEVSYQQLSDMLQVICNMKQIRRLVNWGNEQKEERERAINGK